MNKQLRGQGFETLILTFIGLVIFVMLAYAFLPIVGNAQADSTFRVGANASQSSNGVSFNGSLFPAVTSINAMGPMILAAGILLAIIGASMGFIGVFGR